LKRSGEPADIAKAVWFLINDAEYMTGQILTVDGGRTLFC
jgi:pteridine reductase